LEAWVTASVPCDAMDVSVAPLIVISRAANLFCL